MIVTCRKCRTKFRLRKGAIRPEGTTLRCSRCGTVFRALAPERAIRRPGPPPGVSDEDYILHGGLARAALRPEAPPEVEAPPVFGTPEPAEAEPEKAEPALAQTEAQPESEPEIEQAPPPPEPEPPEPKAAELHPEPPLEPEPEPAPKAAEPRPEPPPEPEPAPPDFLGETPGPEPEVVEAAGQEALEEPWPEPQQPAVEPAGPLPPPRTPVQAPSRLSTWQEALKRRRPLGLAALAAAALLVFGLLIYGSGIIGGGNADPKGTRQITFTGISGYFLKNDHDGVIYVVQGLARNGYQDRRGHIRIKAALYDGAGEAVQEQLVYAGNIFSREDLQRTSLKEITAALAAPVEEGSRSVVRPGATVPFMAVFGNLPKSLGEFSLEAASSSRAASS
jgi:predicted Zn finger-like uncharacterized protein